nr:MAG TPA: Dna polymerase B [Caudoviricetes sp.]
MEDGTIRSGRRKPFVVLYREVAQDKRLSLAARGLFAVMASLPEDWSYTVAGLAKVAGCSKYRTRLLLEELETVGYLVRAQSHGDGGKFGPNTYILQDESPAPLSQNSDNGEAKKTPLSEKAVNGESRQRKKPSTENLTLQKKDNTERL